MGLSPSEAWVTVAALVFLGGCARRPTVSAREAADANDTGRTVEARTASERALLGQIATLPSGSTQRVGDATVVAEESYTAASGRTCRPLHITSNATRRATLRLACLNGRDWLFVPDVYGDSSPSE